MPPNSLLQTQAAATLKSAITTQSVTSTEAQPDVHLQSVREIANYEILALDGSIGNVEDFILETDDWKIHYMTIDTGNWFPGKHVLISAGWVNQINWSHRKVTVNLTHQQIENSPDFDKVTEITREYETRLRNHYNYKATE